MSHRRCGNCGENVGRGENACPRCGASFVAVRCGHCGHRGTEGDFLDDRCPACGERAAEGGMGWMALALVAGGIALLLALFWARP